MLKLAIISGKENGSPRVLAETLNEMVGLSDHSSRVYYNSKAIRRLLSGKEVKKNPVLWFLYRMLHWLKDRSFFREIRKKDAVILCDWSPHGFYRDSYDIKEFKRLTKTPVLYYSVQYLGNSPTIIERLKKGGHALQERYDWHLAVSTVTELRGTPSPPWSQIGLYMKGAGLSPVPKKEFLAIVDFERKGYEKYREDQINVLKELDIPFISLEKSYSLHEIRKLYQQASVLLIQFPEAYGLPIAECLSYGTYVATPYSSWAMSWRLDEKVEVHGPGKLADCFIVYENPGVLRNTLQEIRSEFDAAGTPDRVFQSFISNYPSFYYGNIEALNQVFSKLTNREIS